MSQYNLRLNKYNVLIQCINDLILFSLEGTLHIPMHPNVDESFMLSLLNKKS